MMVYFRLVRICNTDSKRTRDAPFWQIYLVKYEGGFRFVFFLINKLKKKRRKQQQSAWKVVSKIREGGDEKHHIFPSGLVIDFWQI